MNDEEKIIALNSWKYRHGQPGYFPLAKVPQREPISDDSTYDTGWWELDQILRLYLGQFIVLTGIAGHGKSTFMFNLLCNLTRRHKLKSFLYVPENEAFLRNRLQVIWNNDETFEWFSEHCFVQSAVHDVDEEIQSLQWVLERAFVSVEQDGAKIVLIDPWNELDRAKPKDMMMTDYIGHCLMMIKNFCRKMNVIVVVVAHPTKAVCENGGRTATLADIEGSMNWYNKCDNGLIVVRDKNENAARVISAKVREIGAGRKGACEFFVDPQTGIFSSQGGVGHEYR